MKNFQKEPNSRGHYSARSYKTSDNRAPLSNFDKEWLAFREKIKVTSDDAAIMYIKDELKMEAFNRNDISALRNNKPVPPNVVEQLAKILEVRPEYILEKDKFRTRQDYILHKKKEENIAKAIHIILVNLGFADLDMDFEEGDINITMPSNTIAFLTQCAAARKNHENIICDVNADKYIHLSEKDYNLLLYHFADYIYDKMNQLMDSDLGRSIPDLSTAENTLLRSLELIPLKNGETLVFKNHYTPTGQLGEDSGPEIFTTE